MFRRTAAQVARRAAKVARQNNALLASPRISSVQVVRPVMARAMATEAKSGGTGSVSRIILRAP